MNRKQRMVCSIVVAIALIPGGAFGHGPGMYPPEYYEKSFSLNSVSKSLPDPGSFVNFESAHVHPLDINADNSLLAAVNTADARVELFAIDGSGALTHAKSVPVGVDPVTARFRTNSELWVVNHISDSISIVDTTAGVVTKTITTEDEPADVVFITDGGNSDPLAVVTCSRPDLVQVFNATTRVLVDTFEVLGEDPRGLATDGSQVYGAIFNSGNSTTIIGSNVGNFNTRTALEDTNNPYGGLGPGKAVRQPYNNGVPGTAWVTPHGSVDENTIGTLPPPVALIVRKDYSDGNKWKDDNGADWTAYVSGAESDQSDRLPGWDMIDNDIYSISTSAGSTSLDGSFGSSGYAVNLMNICMAIGRNPVDGNIVMVGTEATNEIRFEPNLTGTFVRVRIAIVNPTTGATVALVDMNEEHLDAAQGGAGQAYSDGSVAQSERDKSIGDPRGIAFHPTRGDIYVTGMGSNNVVVIDESDGSRLGGVGHTIEVGFGPTGAVHHGSLDRLYVHNKFGASVSVIDTTTVGGESVVQTADYYDPTPAWVNAGRVHMYGTHENSGLGQIACASCHIDSTMDRLAWDLGDPLGAVKPTIDIANLASPQTGEHNLMFKEFDTYDDFHPMKGPMTTQTLQDIIGKEPHHWRGDRDGIEEFAGAFSGLQGRDAPLNASDMQEFEDFLSSIHFPPNDFRPLDNSLPGGPKFYGAGTNPLLPLPNHFSTGRHYGSNPGNPDNYPAGTQLPDGDAWHGFQLYVDGNPADGSPPMDSPFQCVVCHTLPMGAGAIDAIDLFPNTNSVFQDIAPGPFGEAHQALVPVDGTGEKAFKVPPTRNQMDKVGLFMSPDPSNGNAPYLSRAGFGVLHDGSIAGIDAFLSDNVFDTENDQNVADLVAFVLCMNGSDFENMVNMPGAPAATTMLHPPHAGGATISGVEGIQGVRPPGPDGGVARTAHAALGKQLTIDSDTPSTPDQDLIDLLVAMADDDRVDVIVKVPIGGNMRGAVYDSATDTFMLDEGGSTLTLSQLLALADVGTELTFTTVAMGAGVRMGIDRDEDGLYDYNEFLLGTSDTSSDSDGDGLTDGNEVNTHSTNPANRDTDGDYVNDGTEVALGNSPTNNGDKPQLAEVWVDQNAPDGVPLGTQLAPFDTVLEGQAATANTGTLKLRGDTGAPNFDEQFTGANRLSRPMRIEAHGGAVRIGAAL